MAFPNGGVKLQPLLHKMVEIYVGDVADLPDWWYVADGRSVTLPDGSNATLPDLTGFLCLSNSDSSNTNIMNTLTQSTGKPNNWANTDVVAAAGSHSHNANGLQATAKLGADGGDHTHNSNWKVRGNFFRNSGEWVDQASGDGNEYYINRNAYTNILTKPSKIIFDTNINTNVFNAGNGTHTHNINNGTVKLTDTTTHRHVMQGGESITEPVHKDVFFVVYMGGTE